MRIPFVGGSGPARSPDADNERSVNLYVEMDQGSPRAPAALYGMPGLLLAYTFGAGPIRGMIQSGQTTFTVSGNKVWRRNEGGTFESLSGTLATTFGPVGMATSGDDVLIVDGVSGRMAATNVLALISDPDFPNGVKNAAWLNGYYVVWGDGSEKFYWRPDGSTDWNGLDFASAESAPDDLVGGIADHDQMWFVGTQSAEVFTVVADPDMPFQRSGSSFLEVGTVAPWTVQAFDNSVVWLSRSKEGHGIFIRTQGGNPVRFSDHKVEKAIQSYQWINDAFAFTFQIQGHSFYVCSFPTGDATWVFDAASGEWTEWLWRDPADGGLHQHRASCHAFTTDGLHLVGDRLNGKVYALRLDVYTDNGDPIMFIRRTQNVFDETALLTMQELRIDMQTGVQNVAAPDPKMQMQYFCDGRTPSTWRERRIGPKAAKPVVFSGLGQGRVWSFEIHILDPVKRAVFGGYARVAKSRGGG